MLYTYTCQYCLHKEEDFRKAADKNVLPEINCPICDTKNWEVQEIYLPQRAFALKGEMENFPLRSHIKGKDGKRLVFERKSQYETYLKDRGLAIAGNMPIGTPPDAVVKPNKRLEGTALLRKVQDQAKEQKTKFISKEEVKEWTTDQQ